MDAELQDISSPVFRIVLPVKTGVRMNKWSIKNRLYSNPSELTKLILVYISETASVQILLWTTTRCPFDANV